MELFNHLIKDAAQPFAGWDFSFIEDTGRIQYEVLPWSYGSKARKYLAGAASLLDMGTGGGEFLSKLRPLPADTMATEGYLPNVPLARKKLEPYGVRVAQIEADEPLPFVSNSFDLILNKHESYSAAEVSRVLKQNGIFLTQQVGGTDCAELNQFLKAPKNLDYQDWSLKTAAEELDSHFTFLEQAEAFPVMRFYDIGAVCYYLKAIPWQVPQFSIDDYQDVLYELHCFIEKNGFLEVKQHRFLLAAKPK